MQDRYTGDIGDFGKLGFLRILQASGFSIGVNWYLVADEIHNNDGRHVQYLNDEHIFRCDEPLRNELKRIVESGQREVSALEHELILKACFYSAPLVFAGKTKSERVVARNEWHKEALRCFSGLDLVFVDPDNGILVPSAAETLKENKYVKFEELADYYWQGSTVIYYQHKARRPDRFYTYQHRQLIENMEDSNASGFGLKFCKTSQRYFFFSFIRFIERRFQMLFKNCFPLHGMSSLNCCPAKTDEKQKGPSSYSTVISNDGAVNKGRN